MPGGWQLKGATAIVAAYVAWHLGGWSPKGISLAHAGDLSVLETLCLVIGLEFARARKRVDLPPLLRRGLGWIAGGMLAQFVAGALLIGLMLYGTRVDLVTLLADYVFAGSYVVFIVGILCLPATARARERRLRSIVDATLFIAGIGVPFVLVSILPLFSKIGPDTFAWIVVLPLSAFLGLVTLSWAIETRLVLPSRRAFAFLVAGLGMLWLADVVLSIDRAYSIIPGGTVRWVNALNAVAFLSCLFAARLYRCEPVRPAPDQPLVVFSPLPIITIVVEVGFITLLIFLGPADVHLLTRLLFCLCGVLMLLLARETYIINDNLRLQTAEARLEEKARFEEMVRYSSDVVIVVDHRLSVGFASQTAGTVLGIPAESLLGRNILDFAHPDDRAAAEAFLTELILEQGVARTIQWRLAGPNGAYIEVETSGSNRLSEPSLAGLVLNSRNVTERNALESRLHRARKMEAIGRLAGGVAHDFNNLLTIILANSELALETMAPGDPSRHDVEEIKSAASRGAALTGRMLAFSRTEKIKPKAVEIHELMGESVPLIERATGGGVTLKVEVADEPGWVKVDQDEFVHALINLATNARDAMPKGGTLSVRAYPAILENRPSQAYLDAPPGRYIVVEVADTGSGMDEATLAKAFEPFFTTKERSRGTGLGLASVYGTVKSAGGGISLRSSPGEGTAIQLWLPAVAPESRSMPPFAIENLAKGGAATILLLEDEEPVRGALLRTLRAAGFSVHPAANGDEAIDLFRKHAASIDLLLADVILPGRSGPDIARDLRLAKPGLNVLFMSGYTDRHLADSEVIPEGAKLLPKPFTREKLIATVRDSIHPSREPLTRPPQAS
jgi:PAS domain S-box-containing protein